MTKRHKYSEDDLPLPGTVLLLPLSDGRFGVATILKRITDVDPTESTLTRKIITSRVLAVPSMWVGVDPILPSDAEIHCRLRRSRHSCKDELGAIWISEPPPSEYTHIGSIEITAEDIAINSVTYGGWDNLCYDLLLLWRWDHDREGLLLDEAAEKERIKERYHLYAEKQAYILKNTTLENLAKRSWFDDWDDEWEKPFRQKSIYLIADLIHNLLLLPKLSKAKVRSHLHQCVKEFDKIDAQEPFIQTTHAEDIYEAIELIAIVTKYPDLADQIDDWRDW